MNVPLNISSSLSTTAKTSCSSKDLLPMPLKASSNAKDLFQRLPQALLLFTLSHLSYKDISKVSCVSLPIKKDAEHNLLWSLLYKHYIGAPVDLPGAQKTMVSKALFATDLFKKRAFVEKTIADSNESHLIFRDLRPSTPVDKSWYENIHDYMRCGGNPNLLMKNARSCCFPLARYLFREFVRDFQATSLQDT